MKERGLPSAPLSGHLKFSAAICKGFTIEVLGFLRGSKGFERGGGYGSE